MLGRQNTPTRSDEVVTESAQGFLWEIASIHQKLADAESTLNNEEPSVALHDNVTSQLQEISTRIKHIKERVHRKTI
ncbi:hypothetical protein DM02DRAFT_619729 [Periconia macrospinosa]|uniref:Uncharacterized protein n=1 Tax=Periconia macrospinosa TaxID=97972 RepID=A0A2V1D3Z2_9PLEO|nr:hypothetical protein DM02DRAFT_620348 [Periconia macrospinosa]PVH92746.1 hypothetical protein DM02DRAFT_619729 [Periconia macrospinosa]